MSSSRVPENVHRTILHADMDAFYAAIEQRDCPQLRGKPVIVGGLGRRGVVSAASYEARKFGVHSAMPTAQAKQLCPHGAYLRGRMSEYAKVSGQIRKVFLSFTPLVEPLSLDEAFLDVTASRNLFGDGESIAKQIREQVREKTELTISVGVASSKYVAKVASDLDKPDGLVVVPSGQEKEFLAKLEIKRLWGVGPRQQKRLGDLGFSRIADLQRLSLEQMAQLFGEVHGEHYYRLCRGIDSRPVSPDRMVKSVSHEQTFEVDLATPDDCRRVLLELSEMVGRRLRKSELRGRTVRLKIRKPDFTTFSRQKKLPSPTADDMLIYKTVAALYEAVRSKVPLVRLLGVGVSELLELEATTQGELFAAEAEKSAELMQAMDEIRDRFGEKAIRHGRGR